MEENEVKQTNSVTESKGLSIASMILGIVSLVMLCVYYVSIPCAILAIIFAIIGRKKGGKGMATTGLVLGIVGLSIGLVIVIGIMVYFGEIASALLTM